MLSLIDMKQKLSKNKRGRIIIKTYHYFVAVPLLFYNFLKFKFIKKNIKIIKFYNLEDTFNKLIEQRKSLCRFGDGEVSWIYKDSKGHFGQKNSEELSNKLYKVINSKDKEILIAIPNFFGKTHHFNGKKKIQRDAHLSKYYKRWMTLLHEDYLYTDALITRVYMGVINKNFKESFDKWKEVWKNREVLIIEGNQTRFGVGNDLLKNTKSIKRIIGPAENAFEKYDELLKATELYVTESTLVLVSLGPTATLLAYDLAKMGVQAIDIGHLDIEYEWYLLKATKKVSITGKYVNEAGGNYISEMSEKNLANYNLQIVHKLLF